MALQTTSPLATATATAKPANIIGIRSATNIKKLKKTTSFIKLVVKVY